MNYYKVTLLAKGKKEEVILKGENKQEILETLKSSTKYKGIAVKVEPTSMPFDEKMKQLQDIIKANFSKKKLDYPAFIGAIRQLSALTLAQISLKDSLENISNNATDELVKELFRKAYEGIDNGLNLSSTFEEYKTYVGNLAVAMIKLGEQTGSLGDSLKALADIYEDIEENRQKFKKAMRYPMITLIAMAGAFTILIMYVVPKFKDIFEQLHTELPLPTKILLGLEYGLNHYGPIIVAIGIVIFIAHKFMYKTNPTYKYKTDQLILKTKIIGPVTEFSSVSRFLLVLTELSKAGISLIESLEIANGILENSVLKEKIDGVIREINQGQSLTFALTKYELLDNITLQMISAGEEAGNLDTMLENASAYYKNQFQQIVDGVGDAIEPIMMAVIGGLVLLLALGIFMPMWNMADAAKAG
jgi:general secretion pathway protein F/MSHA biogenesis protein MshG